MGVARCPMCHQANHSTAWQCDRCGYEFGQSIETLNGMLQAQLRRSLTALTILVAIDVAIVGVVAYCAIVLDRMVLPSVLFVMAMVWTVRVGHKVGVTRHSLKLIAPKPAELPKATLRSK